MKKKGTLASLQEIRFHGRGGQGTVVASVLLAKAFFKSGYYVQSFPAFGVERRGAPVEAYLRIAKQKILARSNVSAPNHILIQDIQLLQTSPVTKGLLQGGWILLNVPDGTEFLHRFSEFSVAAVNATRIGIENGLGTRTHPIVNTAMIGAFARILQAPSLEDVVAVIKTEVPVKPEANAAAAIQAFENVQIYEKSSD